MNYFQEILNRAMRQCHETYSSLFDYIYPFTTENISGYINEFTLENRSLLTVGSSSDQVLNAILYGCENVTLLDINPYTKFYYYLKVACILTLNKEEYLEFLRYYNYPKVFKDNKNCFNIEIFNKIKSTLLILDYESYLFWCELFKNFSPLEIRKNLFSTDEDRTDIIVNSNPYLINEQAYKTLRKKLENVEPNFMTTNLLKDEVIGHFDNIWLSNIPQYLTTLEIKHLADNTINALKHNGLMLISYLYQTTINTPYNKDWEPIYNLPQILNLLKEYNPYLSSFLGVKGLKFKDEKIKDSIILCRKL